MNFSKDSNPMNAAPKELPQEKGGHGGADTKETAAHARTEQGKAAASNDSQFLHVQQVLHDRRGHSQEAPILILQGNQIIKVGPSLADPTLVPQLVPANKLEFSNKTASGSLTKEGESTKRSLARAHEKCNGVTDAHSVMVVNEGESRPSHSGTIQGKSVPVVKSKSKSVRNSKHHSPSSSSPNRSPSGGHENKKPKSASSKSSSSKVISSSRTTSSSSDGKSNTREGNVEKTKSKSKSPRKKKKPTSSKLVKSSEQMSKSKSKSDKHRQTSSTNSEMKKSGQLKLVKIKTKSSSGKANANMKNLKNAESASSSASSTESSNFKSHKLHSHKKGK